MHMLHSDVHVVGLCYSKFQQKLSSDLLVSLATSLLDSTIFDIVSGISDIQRLEEEDLFNQRKKLLNDLTG